MAVSVLSFADDDRGVWGRARALRPSDQDNSWQHDMGRPVGHFVQNFQSRRFPLQRYSANHVSDNKSQSLQNTTPSSVPQTYSERDDMPSPTEPKNFGASAGPTTETRTELHRALTVHVTDPAKLVARKTGASPDTVDHHRQGNVPQSWAQMIAYCRAYPAFALDVIEMMGLDIDRDREAYALFLSLQRQMRGQ